MRRFYAKLAEVWPYWLFFGNLDTDGLRMVSLCCSEKLDALAAQGRPLVQVAVDLKDAMNFVVKHLPAMNMLCDGGRKSDREVTTRDQELFRCFGL
ncbi:MAG: hypothetical protein KDK99_07910 [Verrucomicrobiales bacterium]|nr:hypothetical protein [Verrucomicrobiales bacterium]